MAEENVRILPHGHTSGGANSGGFGISVDDLKHMMELRKGEAIVNLQNIGGIDQLCKMLHTSPTDGMF